MKTTVSKPKNAWGYQKLWRIMGFLDSSQQELILPTSCFWIFSPPNWDNKFVTPSVVLSYGSQKINMHPYMLMLMEMQQNLTSDILVFEDLFS